jgi:hypothetical protein
MFPYLPRPPRKMQGKQQGAAEAWIHRIHESMDNGTGFSLAVVRKADGALLGCSAIQSGLRQGDDEARHAI